VDIDLSQVVVADVREGVRRLSAVVLTDQLVRNAAPRQRGESLRPPRQLERGRFELRDGGGGFLRSGGEHAWGLARDRPREERFRPLQVTTGEIHEVDGTFQARRLGAGRRDHVATATEVGVRDEQAEELRLVAEAGPRRIDSVIRRDVADIATQLLDDTARIRDPLTLAGRRRDCATAHAERGHDEHGGALSKHQSILFSRA
jgi:hypothetical protein